MRPQITDLFGQVIVTTHDIDAWLLAVPRIDPLSRRAVYYVKDYSVVDKIKAAKLAGYFEALIAKHDPPPPNWWERFSWLK